MRHAMLIGIAALAAGCAGGSDGDSTTNADNAFTGVTPTTCATPATPSSFDDLTKLNSCELKALFESDTAKEATSTSAALANGAYDGLPLCRKDILPSGSQLPPQIQAIHGAGLLIDLLKLSNSFDNSFASKIWHGKEFTLQPGAESGTVLNFIDIQSDGISATTRKAAEAVHFIDHENKWMVLDYTNAVTGIEGLLQGVSVQLIAHVYDTARLVNAQENLYLGMAWLVDSPGKYEPGTKNTVPSCYFALKLHK